MAKEKKNQVKEEKKDMSEPKVKEEKKEVFDLNRRTARLMMEQPFFAAISRQVDKSASNALPTAGVRVNPNTGYFELLYNPEFMGGLTEVQCSGVLMHEFYHLIFRHVTDRNPSVDGKVSPLWNIATDLAINSHLMPYTLPHAPEVLIHRLPEDCCMPGTKPFEKYPIGKSAEWYFSELNNDPNFDQLKDPSEASSGGPSENPNGNGNGNGQFDSHDQWGTEGGASETQRRIAGEKAKEILRKAANEAAKCDSWGTISADMKELIMRLIKNTIDWRKVLRWFIKVSQRAEKTSTVRKLNRRYPYIHPGRKVTRTSKIAVAIDESGSVSNEMLAKFFGELNGLAQTVEFTLVPFDTSVNKDAVEVWKKGKLRLGRRTRCGGTNFNAPTEWVNERKFDGLIILTDMEAPKPKPCKCQRMWVVSEEAAAKPYFATKERIIGIPIDRK